MANTLIRLAAGFIAGALAVLIFHQGMYFIMAQFGVPLRGAPWRMTPMAPLGVPVLLNAMFWGGLWGMVFAAICDHLPGRQAWLKGLIFGILFPMLLGSWLIVSLIKGRPVFAGAFVNGFNPMALRAGFLLNGVAFGIGLGLLYAALAKVMPVEAHAADEA